MKAAWTWAEGNVEDDSEGIKTCAENLVKLLINIAGSLTTRGKADESEAILREALQVCHVIKPTCTDALALHIVTQCILRPVDSNLLCMLIC